MEERRYIVRPETDVNHSISYKPLPRKSRTPRVAKPKAKRPAKTFGRRK